MGRSFKVLLVIVVKFDLKLYQYDVVNTFIYTKLNKVVYIRMPLGYEKKDMVFILYKALYRLRKSPLLW